MKKIKLLFFLTLATFLFACGKKDPLIGTWKGTAGSVLVIREDKTATVDGGSGPIEGKWYIKNGYIFIDRVEKADLMAKIPNGDFNSITLEKDPNNHDGKWNSEIMTKVANDNNK